jgi:Holliday junction resolvasome RuvABC endonuclease subunit
MRLVSFDPGAAATGYAVLEAPATLLTAGTWIPRASLTWHERYLWVMSRVQDVLEEYQPAWLAVEEFVTTWKKLPLRGDAQTETPQPRSMRERFPMHRVFLERLLGGMHAQCLVPPYPVLVPVVPDAVPLALLGQASHVKGEIARAVNARLGTQYRGDHFDEHIADAVAVGLVVLEQQALWRTVTRVTGQTRPLSVRSA